MKRLRKVAILFLLLLGSLLLNACETPVDPDVEAAQNYEIGDLVTLGSYEFNVYAIKSGSIYLLATNSIGTVSYNEINQYLSKFSKELDDLGINYAHIGLLDYETLDNLGGNKHTVSISGQPYLCDDAPSFVHFEEGYWLSGYSKYDTYTWLYENEKIYHTQFEDYKYAVRPAVRILATEIPD
jgi:hypothetical protein